ncbi:ArsR/SmtB family transcription factor [Streptomyces sp. NPDC094153]|uniref:ArsR/SmtB family transcription factor n=1 Tax=Streptomyces sp. NPDC094153 TaxID=3366058 RepID=UPI0037F9B970
MGGLVGRTRAAILEDVVTGRTTSELAERIGISGAAASQHTAVLREAGLLVSVRRNRHVLHTVTPVGLALLDGRGASILSGGPSRGPGSAAVRGRLAATGFVQGAVKPSHSHPRPGEAKALQTAWRVGSDTRSSDPEVQSRQRITEAVTSQACTRSQQKRDHDSYATRLKSPSTAPRSNPRPASTHPGLTGAGRVSGMADKPVGAPLLVRLYGRHR